MTCPEAFPLLSASLDDALSADERVELGRHLATCTNCRSQFERLQLARNAFRDVAPVRQRQQRRWSSVPPAAAAAAGLAAALVLVLTLLWPQPPPGDASLSDVVFMDVEYAGVDEPCFFATDCGVPSAPQMP